MTEATVIMQQEEKNRYIMPERYYNAYNTDISKIMQGTKNSLSASTKNGSIKTLYEIIHENSPKDLVNYTISNDILIEEHFISDGITMINGTPQPILNERLLNPDGKTLKKNIIDSIKSSIMLNDEYQYRWVNNTILCVDSKNNPVNIDSIPNDDFYTIKLLELVMKKGLHKGVLFLHGKTLSKKVKTNVTAIIKLLCDSYIIIDVQ